VTEKKLFSIVNILHSKEKMNMISKELMPKLKFIAKLLEEKKL